jgi:hypothetical protein
LAKHEFGLIDQFEENKWYDKYEPQKYHCVSVDMDIMDRIFEANQGELMQIKTFAAISTQPLFGLDESGVTLVPPASLKPFCDVIVNANIRIKSPQLSILVEKVQEAMEKSMYLIHFGI